MDGERINDPHFPSSEHCREHFPLQEGNCQSGPQAVQRLFRRCLQYRRVHSIPIPTDANSELFSRLLIPGKHENILRAQSQRHHLLCLRTLMREILGSASRFRCSLCLGINTPLLLTILTQMPFYYRNFPVWCNILDALFGSKKFKFYFRQISPKVII